MIKRNKWSLLLSSLVILLPMVFGVIVWDRLPEQIAIHWNAQGEVDGWSSRALAVFAMPLFLFVLHWVCAFVTAKDPKNDGHNGRMLWLVLWVTPTTSLLCNALVYATAFGVTVSVERVMPLVLGLVFMVIGNYIPKFKQNHTIGIKIPWTLNDEENWNATHRFTGKVWMVGGFAILFTAFLPKSFIFIAFFLCLIPLVAAPFIYSYRFYKRHK